MRPKLSKYEVLGELATGGMADVWLARTAGSGVAGFEKVVVLKTILPHLGKDPAFVEMFFNEARVAALLNHPNCVQIFDVGEDGGSHYIAMEFIEGFSLSRIFSRVSPKRMPIAVVARIGMDAAAGLDYAHRLADREGRALNLVHRDVSPDNILVSFAGHTKMVDFGIAKAATPLRVSSQTRTGTVKGKHGYMAPEYLRGLPIDGRADVFALGVCLYKALTGLRPFNGATDAMIAQSVLEATPTAPRTLYPEIPPPLEKVILKALAKEPSQRFESARAFRTALERAVPRPADMEHVGQFMESLWPVGDTERNSMLQLAAGKRSDPSVPILKSLPDTADLEGQTLEAPSARHQINSRRRRMPLVVGGIVVCLVVGGITLAAARSGHSATEDPGPGPGVGLDPVLPTTAVPDQHPTDPTADSQPPMGIDVSTTEPPTDKTKLRRNGRVEISSPAPAEVYFKSKLLGRAPGVFELPVGHQTLHVVCKDLGLERDMKATINPDRTTQIRIALSKASVDVRASPWAEVKLDGKPMGTTPFPPLDVSAGHHVLELSNPETGKTSKIPFDVASGERKTIRENLE